MNNPTFEECFCAKHNIPAEDFTLAVFNLALYRRTYLFKRFLPLFHSNYFAADFDLILGVAHLRRARDFGLEFERFNEHPANHGWLRRTFCLRVSTNRLKALFHETMPQRTRKTHSRLSVREGAASRVPF